MNLEDLWENKRLAGESFACNISKITLVFLFGFEELPALEHRALCNLIHVSFTIREKTHYSV
jgi:hypothetical protein